jgi:Predicted transcriptional regulator
VLGLLGVLVAVGLRYTGALDLTPTERRRLAFETERVDNVEWIFRGIPPTEPDRRVELLRSIMTERPDSIRQLAERLDRDVKSLHDNLQVLTDYDIVHFEQAGRSKRPFVPYDTIEVNLNFSAPGQTDDTAPA